MAKANNNNETKEKPVEFEKFDINEYETQFFGFTPKSFLDGVYNAISDYVGDCFGELEKQLASEPTLTKTSTPEQIHQKCDAMLKRFYNTVDNSFDHLEIFLLMKVFEIPAHILLPEDKPHEGYNYTEEEEAKVNHELLDLQRKIKAAKYVNASLKQENNELDFLQTKLTECNEYLEKLDNTCQSGLDIGLKESLQFTYDQAKKLQAQLDGHKASNEEEDDGATSAKRKKIDKD